MVIELVPVLGKAGFHQILDLSAAELSQRMPQLPPRWLLRIASFLSGRGLHELRTRSAKRDDVGYPSVALPSVRTASQNWGLLGLASLPAVRGVMTTCRRLHLRRWRNARAVVGPGKSLAHKIREDSDNSVRSDDESSSSEEV